MLAASTIHIIAWSLLAALCLGLATYTIVALRRSPYTLMQALLFAWSGCMARVLWRVKITGRMDLPKDQGAIIVCNHRSSADPTFLQLAAGRLVHWMVAREYCQQPVFGWFLRGLGAIPVGRGGIDTAATKAAIRWAAAGELVGVFPEGRINRTDDVLLPGRPGAVLMALKARVPIVPCFLTGSPYSDRILGPLVMPARVRLAIGPPIDTSAYYGRDGEREVLEQLTLQVLREMARLAGHPDFEPRLAGRHYRPEEQEPWRPPDDFLWCRRPACPWQPRRLHHKSQSSLFGRPLSGRRGTAGTSRSCRWPCGRRPRRSADGRH
jgi:1-acyl-sn-glycerol-3-phosphate acyltransferase